MTCPPIKWSRGKMAVVLLISIILIDQVSKIIVKTNMSLHECIDIFSWFKIVFIENNGMAYGMEIGSKLLLSALRVLLIAVLAHYLVIQVKENAKWGYITCLVMILAGAIGNMIDGMFYGLMFSASTTYTVAELVEFGHGYSSFMTGKVVDMLHFPLIDTQLPEWLPIWGGDDYVFFSPVFNFADSCISVGVVALLIWFRDELSDLTLDKILGRKTDNERDSEDNNKM
ncbi:MAG: lipoprotein signal peptidase [Prevotella sp.]|uniref:lipoprotein signal peptidase n=1 Tax=Prevotella sp. P5-92 TaxID=2024222 RepID=UPI0020B13868|nr:lipoprotein signal peptidase [Prevotella sp. P5-92]MCI7399703.1 lipoprotein signal peptidase [Prevotella sp.]MDY4653630.1 lipoprotein signal peptidase [Prevotella sp.]